MFPWSNPQRAETARFSVGDRVASDNGKSAGTVTQVSVVVAPIMAIVWDDGDGGEIIYPLDAPYIRRAYPWEK